MRRPPGVTAGTWLSARVMVRLWRISNVALRSGLNGTQGQILGLFKAALMAKALLRSVGWEMCGLLRGYQLACEKTRAVRTETRWNSSDSTRSG